MGLVETLFTFDDAGQSICNTFMRKFSRSKPRPSVT